VRATNRFIHLTNRHRPPTRPFQQSLETPRVAVPGPQNDSRFTLEHEIELITGLESKKVP